MKTVIVKKSMWHTQGGRTKHDSYLRSDVSKRMCCLGFAAQQAGCTGLTGCAFPSDLPGTEQKKFIAAYPKLRSLELVEINDNTKTTRKQKAQEITRVGQTMGVNFVFI